MFCYRDKTWCNFKDCSEFSSEKCWRVMTDRDREVVKKENFPVCLYAERPKCFVEVEK